MNSGKKKSKHEIKMYHKRFKGHIREKNVLSLKVVKKYLHRYWLGQKVCSGFSEIPNEFFGQINTSGILSFGGFKTTIDSSLLNGQFS